MKTVLWIDDEEYVLAAGVELFREYGFEVLTATNTTRALTILREQRLDGVLLDVKLGNGEDGLELLPELHRLYPTLKIVIFTAFPDNIDHFIAERLGASFYFAKMTKLVPVDPSKRDEFFAALHEIFETTPEATNPLKSNLVTPLSIFCSYSHRDAKLRHKLDEHLANLKRSGMVSTWHDQEIIAGKEWAREIDERLNAADIILLLVSASFMASDYCNSVEVKRALERHDAGEARVIPIILRPADWQNSPLGKLQALPKDAKPATLWADRDEAFLNIAQGISKVITEIRRS